MKPLHYFIVPSILFIIKGCTLILGPEGIAYADVTDAVFLGTTNPGQGSETSNNVFKIADNSIHSVHAQVDFLSESGNILGDRFMEVDAHIPILLSPEYTILYGDFRFNLKGGETHSNGLLLDIENGSVFDLGYDYNPCPHDYYKGSKYYQQDASGNIYYLDRGIKRFLFKDPDHIVIEHYMDYTISYDDQFFVDAFGNVFFERGQMLKLATGGIIETNLELLGFNGFDNSTLALSNETKDIERGIQLSNFLGLSFDSFTMDYKILNTSDYYVSSFKSIKYYADSVNKIHFILSKNISNNGMQVSMEAGLALDELNNEIFLIKLPENMPYAGNLLGLEASYIWFREGSILFAVDMRNFELKRENGILHLLDYTEITLPEEIKINNLSLRETQVIYFAGYNLQTEKRMEGYVSMANGLEIYESEKMGSVNLTRIR